MPTTFTIDHGTYTRYTRFYGSPGDLVQIFSDKPEEKQQQLKEEFIEASIELEDVISHLIKGTPRVIARNIMVDTFYPNGTRYAYQREQAYFDRCYSLYYRGGRIVSFQCKPHLVFTMHDTTNKPLYRLLRAAVIKHLHAAYPYAKVKNV